jgi:hypothetical protein
LDPAPKCQAGKNKEAGKYSYCQQKAEAKAITAGLPADYTKCEAKFLDKWTKLESKAGGACPDEPLDPNSLADFITEQCDIVAHALATGDLATCGDNTINVAGEQCNGTDLGGESCVSLGFDSGTLGCTTGCTLDTSGCACPSPTGDAAVGDVLSGKTFSNAGGSGLTGTMPNNGAVVLTPSISNQPIAAGYHNGSGYCEGDADLVSANVRSTASIFGVAGDLDVVDTSSGDAAAGDLLTGKTAWVDGAEAPPRAEAPGSMKESPVNRAGAE